MRGNLDTRIRKLDEGQFDAIILAAAGVKRLGLENRITELLSPEISLPAIGQGAVGIETRIDDNETNKLAAFLNHKETSIAVRAERAFLKKLEGGCQVPIAAYGVIIPSPLAGEGQGEGEFSGSNIKLTGLVASVDGKKIIKDVIIGNVDDAESLGVQLAETLLNKGAWDILKEVYTSR